VVFAYILCFTPTGYNKKKERAMRYKFILLEGGDCVGKSTIGRQLYEYITTHEVVLTREPGGSPGAEDIRKLVLEGEIGRWNKETELLLFFAARMNHLEKLIIPSLQAGKVVITDRFDLSTWVFQAETRPELHDLFFQMHQRVWNQLFPWISKAKGILLDAPAEVVLERMVTRTGGKDRMEAVDKKTISRRRDSYIDAAELKPGYDIVDASQENHQVFKEILTILDL
tara:strand:+ start:2901 stop:3581 length:681 start_codon:yes stop_codon:yes gene_type:complete